MAIRLVRYAIDRSRLRRPRREPAGDGSGQCASCSSDGEPDGPEDRWFDRLGNHVADILHEVGVPYCKGGVMARNAQWRGSIATWQARIADWIRRSRPQDLLSVDIFFDMRGVHGEAWPCRCAVARCVRCCARATVELRQAAGRGIGRQRRTRARLVRPHPRRKGPHRSQARRTVRDRLDGAGLAIRHHVLERATPARLVGVQRARRRRRRRYGRAGRGAGGVPRPVARPTGQGCRARHATDERRGGQGIVASRSRAAAHRARCGAPPRPADPRSAVPG